MSKYIKIAVGVIVVIAIGAAGAKAIKNAKEKDASLPVAKIYPIVVKHLSPKIKNVKLTLPYLAEVANDKDVKLSSRIAARILSIKPSGAAVKKGEVIARLDTTNIKSSLESIKKQLQAADVSLSNLKATHKRTEELLKVQAASIEESQKELSMIANSEAHMASLKQQEIELKNNLSYATIISPVNGVIAKTYDNVGAVSMPGKPLLAISSKNGFYLMLRIPSDLSIRGVEFNGHTYPVTALGSTYHGLSEYKVYNGNSKLTSGDRVEISVIVFNANATLLPFNALLNREGKSFVLVIEGNHAIPKEVHIIQSAEQGVVISDSLEDKNIVIAKPDILLKLTSGYALKVKD